MKRVILALFIATVGSGVSLVRALEDPDPTNPPFLDCGGEITVTDDGPVYLESPGFPDIYPNNADCTWYIAGPEGYDLTVNAEVFDLEEVGFRGTCDYDTLTMTDLTATGEGNMGIYCDELGPVNIKTAGNKMKLVLLSDDETEESGFRLRIEKSTCPHGSDICPNAPANSPAVCVKPEHLCDGKKQCPGGEDEVCPLGCGIPDSSPVLNTKSGGRIVGGVEAKPHTWPWQVSMQFGGRHLCGASIIDHHWIVTAAHCCNAFKNSPIDSAHTFKVRVGEHDLNGGHESNAWTYDLERVVKHPLYNTKTEENDICLLKTKQPIFFNKDVSRVCLGPAVPPPVGTSCYVTGWGDLEEEPFFRRLSHGGARLEKSSDVRLGKSEAQEARALRQVDVKLITRESCVKAYQPKFPVTQDMICAYNPGKDSCQGDSGGPFVCQSQEDPRKWEMAGIVSWGLGCARPDIPGVYANTAHFLDWIAETTKN